MPKRTFRLPSPAIAISAIALLFALGGTALAAGTSSDPDKAADTKLIKKLAPTLSVKSAKLLSGKSATSLETSAYTYKLPATTNQSDAVYFSLPGLPPGIYYASYDVVCDVAASSDEVLGEFKQYDGGGANFALSYGADAGFGDYASTSGAGIVDTRKYPVQFRLDPSDGQFSIDTTTPPDVTFVPIDKLHTTSSSIAVARRASAHRATNAAGK